MNSRRMLPTRSAAHSLRRVLGSRLFFGSGSDRGLLFTSQQSNAAEDQSQASERFRCDPQLQV